MSRNDPMSVGNRRLLKLAAFLDTVPDSKFSYSNWAAPARDGDGYRPKGKAVLTAKPIECNTVACALGWATAIPSLRKLGLGLSLDREYGTNYVVLKGVTLEEVKAVNDASVLGPFDLPNTGSVVAAMRVFHMSEADARSFFLNGNRGTYPSAIACNLRSYVASEERMNGRV